MIEILTTGQPNSIQDLGRSGQMASGVSLGGAMDRLSLEAANILLGNDPGAAGIEVAYFPFRLRFHVAANVAVTGADCATTLDGIALPPCWAFHVKAGQVLALTRPSQNSRAYIAIARGIDVPIVLNSRATDQKSGFGGLAGKGLARGNRLDLLPGDTKPIASPGFGYAPFEPPESGPELTLRVLPAAEAGLFDAASVERFRSESWVISPDANRMGFRLQGSPLTLVHKLELLSHGIVPGTVQIPPAGQPMIQMADANTCGGYPKIATVIEADQDRLAQAAIGTRLRFKLVEWQESREALTSRLAWIDDLRTVSALLR